MSPISNGVPNSSSAQYASGAVKSGIKALSNTVVAAVGPVVADTLRKRGVLARVMPEESFFLKPLTSALEKELGGASA